MLEIWKVLSDEEVRVKMKRQATKKQRKEQKTVENKIAAGWGEIADGREVQEVVQTAQNEFKFVQSFSAEHKLRSFDFLSNGVVLATTRNTLERCV